jgi:hypothetical protein
LDQRVEQLSEEECAYLERQGNWVRDHYDPEARGRYESLEGKLHLLEGILRSDWVGPEETWKLQSLGVTFGDALAQQLELTWVAVEDEIDRTPAVQDIGTTIILFPLPMIEKRAIRGERFDVRSIFSELCAKVGELRAKWSH